MSLKKSEKSKRKKINNIIDVIFGAVDGNESIFFCFKFLSQKYLPFSFHPVWIMIMNISWIRKLHLNPQFCGDSRSGDVQIRCWSILTSMFPPKAHLSSATFTLSSKPSNPTITSTNFVPGPIGGKKFMTRHLVTISLHQVGNVWIWRRSFIGASTCRWLFTFVLHADDLRGNCIGCFCVPIPAGCSECCPFCRKSPEPWIWKLRFQRLIWRYSVML